MKEKLLVNKKTIYSLFFIYFIGDKMKQTFKILGLIILVSFSFIYTEKTVKVIREYDTIMIDLKKIKSIKPIEAITTKNTIIPGINGKKINIDKSYTKMKEYGEFNSKLLVYDDVYPNEVLSNNKDKFIISGNSNKYMISVIFLTDEKYVDKLNKYNIKSNYMIKKINNINLYKNNLVGFYKNYDNWSYSLAKSNNIKIDYCFSEEKSNCFKNNLYVIKTDIIKNNYLSNTKKYLKSGAIITYKVNDYIFKELPLIINYINSKGYKIEYLSTLLEE